MRGRDKMLELIDGETLLHRSARIATESNATQVHVVTLPQRRETLTDLQLYIIETPCDHPMSKSLNAGMSEIDGDAVIIALADMPDITSEHYNRLIAAFDPVQNREICRAQTADGKSGHPVLFSRRFFPELTDISGDQGAKTVITNNPQYLHNVPTVGQGAITDLDTPEDWQNWRK